MSDTHGHKTHHKLNELYATAICGNDILSSCLYTAGIASIFAGVYAPLVLLLVGVSLWFFRHVYTEVVEALPINGGAYNCLLNGTSKPIAAIAGVMTILSYVATACLSAKVGVEYFARAFEEHTGHFDTTLVAIVLLGGFAALVIGGLKDSAKVALGIFLFHIFTLVLILVFGIEHWLVHGTSQFWANYEATKSIVFTNKGLLWTLYLGFSASLLGISGFESSANFVEEQEPGVFRKTLRNMWLGVIIFNPLIALVALNTLSISAIKGASDFMLADVSFTLGGDLMSEWGPVIMRDIIAIDALLVLSGAVLTAYVGVGGLIQRMALDGCLPNILTKKNSKGSFPITVISFFLLCSSILLITHGNMLSLAGVYTIAFLGVMTLFAFGNLILKRERSLLERTYSSPIKYVVIALLAAGMGMVGNMVINQEYVYYFMIYFIPTITVVFGMIFQDYLLEFIYRVSQKSGILKSRTKHMFDSIIRLKIVVFVHNRQRLFEILKYIARNEVGRRVVLIHCDSDTAYDKESGRLLSEALPILKESGVYQHLDVSLETFEMKFGPEAVQAAVKKFHVPTNRILVGSVHHFHEFSYEDLGGVRIIY
ncbi:MAG: APC family permease [bacterium]